MRWTAFFALPLAAGVLAAQNPPAQALGRPDSTRPAMPVLSIPIPPAGTLVAITNATILTASHGTIEQGTIVIRNGKIAAIGKDIAVPAGAQVIDGKGKYVMPGIIDAHSHSAGEAINEGSRSVTAQVRMQDVLREDAIGLYRELAGGVTAANVLHGSANTIGGQNAVIKLRWGLPVDSLLFAGAPPGIKFALGENVRQTNGPQIPGRPQRYPRTRMGQEEVLRDARSPARANTRRNGRPTTRRRRPGRKVSSSRFPRRAICSSMRWWKCSRASGWSTRTRIAPTRS